MEKDDAVLNEILSVNPNASSELQDTFKDFYYNNCFYTNYDGHTCQLSPDFWKDVFRDWDKVDPQSYKKSLFSALKQQKQKDYENFYEFEAYDEESDSNLENILPPYKILALSQISFSHDYFPSEEAYEQAIQEVKDLPDDRTTVYNYLHDRAMLNLRYVPNKIRLISEYMEDRNNLKFAELSTICKNHDLQYDDIINFKNKNSKFNLSNYTKAVNEVMEILGNHKDDGQRFRKLHQLSATYENWQYRNYDSYFHGYQNSQYDDDDDDDDDYLDYDAQQTQDELTDISTLNEAELEEEHTKISNPFYDDIQFPYENFYGFFEDDFQLQKIYMANETQITDAAYKLSRIFGAQSKNFIRNYLKVNDAVPVNINETNKEKSTVPNRINNADETRYLIEEKVENILESHLQLRKRINASKLKMFSLEELKKETKREAVKENFKSSMLSKNVTNKTPLIYSEEVRQNLLKLFHILPDDFTPQKYASFANFMHSQFFYTLSDGTKKTRDLEELQKIITIWPQLSAVQEKMRYDEILKLSNGNEYLNGRLEEFVSEAKINNLPRSLFDVAQSAYIRGIDTPRTIPGNASLKTENFTLRLMDTHDPSIMFVGNGFSCQSITKAGAYPALSSVQDPFSRALVVERKDKPVGLAWLWTNKETINGKDYTSLCIDNIEFSNYLNLNEEKQIISGLRQLAKSIADDNNFRRVTIGAKSLYFNPKNYFSETEALELPEQYKNQKQLSNIKEKIIYGDSANQLLIYENPQAIADDITKPLQVYVAHRDAYTITDNERTEALNVGNAAYPWKAEFREEDKNSKFMLLMDMQKNVLGYALYSDINKHIYDVAVHPKYRSYSKNLLFPLFNHMKEEGGIWKAETRKDTSYALLKKLDERGSINLIEHRDSIMGIQGEKLNVISIEFNDTAAKFAKLKKQMPTRTEEKPKNFSSSKTMRSKSMRPCLEDR